ncbi:MAG TPA: hypothetical protein VHW66_19045 [Stellaceae bacterium]|jgi:hypothetical protein|nr:hypothetical protein [Stellaceae bacterium]
MKTLYRMPFLLALAVVAALLAVPVNRAHAATMQCPVPGQILAVSGFPTSGPYTVGSDGIVTGVNANDVPALVQDGCVSLGTTAGIIGRLLAANMNATTDQPIPMFVNAAEYFRITKISMKNCSVSMTTAAGGVYPAASKGGTAIVANTQVYTALSAATIALDLTIVSGPGNTLYAGTVAPTFALTTAQGAAGTCDIFVEGQVGQ